MPPWDLLLSGHKRRIAEVTRAERDVLLAWMDGNSNYYGTWNFTQHATCDAIMTLKDPLAREMQAVGCVDCHPAGHIGSDWVNLKRPAWSRIVRAHLYQDGKEVAKVPCNPSRTPWPGALHVGQYSAGPGPQYQVKGRVRGLRIYQRALAAEK